MRVRLDDYIRDGAALRHEGLDWVLLLRPGVRARELAAVLDDLLADFVHRDDERSLSYAEAAERLGISEKTLHRMVEAGQAPCTRYGRAVRFSPENLAEILASHRRGPP